MAKEKKEVNDVLLNKDGTPRRKSGVKPMDKRVVEEIRIEPMLREIHEMKTRMGDFTLVLYQDDAADNDMRYVAKVSRKDDPMFTYHAREATFDKALEVIRRVLQGRCEGEVYHDPTADTCLLNPNKMRITCYTSNNDIMKTSTIDITKIVAIDSMSGDVDEGYFRVYFDNAIWKVANECYYKVYDAWVHL